MVFYITCIEVFQLLLFALNFILYSQVIYVNSLNNFNLLYILGFILINLLKICFKYKYLIYCLYNNKI